MKKQKAVKKAVVDAKPTKKSAPKAEKKKVAEKVEVVEEEMLDVPEESSDSEEENEEVQALAAKLDPEEDATTEGGSYTPGQDVGKIPKVSKKVQEGDESSKESGVLYIGHIPHGFYEHEMRAYFGQFGPVLRLKLSRNKKTGNSKHYAFVEFAEASTADIVVKTMNNYLLFGRVLKVIRLANEDVHKDLFKGANRRFKKVPWNKLEGNKLKKPLTESAWADKVSKEKSKRAKKAAKLKEIGYEFEAPEIKDVPVPALIENGEVEPEVKAIEAAPAEDTKSADEVEVEAEAVAAEEEPEAEKTISAPKTKAAKATKGKAAKTGKGKKAKA